MQPLEIARELYRRDPSAETFGIELVDASLDGSQVRMPVRAEICNGYGMIHGGMTFLLADTAMAFASCTSNETALATSAQVDWVAPARVGQTLTATARRQWSAGRTTIWDVEIATDDGTTIAMFRGRTRKVGTPVIEGHDIE